MESPNSGDHQAGPIDGIDEFAAIDRLRSRFESAARSVLPEGPLPPPGQTWIGDDAAVLTLGSTDPSLWATDLVVEGVHVDLDLSGLDDAGYKALMVTVSDLAAMGAWPGFALVSIAAPGGTDLDLLGAGLAEAARDSGCVVVGGDLQDYWYELDAMTGKFIGKLDAPESPNSHNLNLSADGKTAFMSPNNKVMTISDVKTRKIIKTIRFPDNIRVFVSNKDSSR